MAKERRICLPNPALIEAKATQRYLQERGSDSRFVGKGGRTDWEKVFYHTLLGTALKEPVEPVDYNSLSPYERNLLPKVKQGEAEILTILDWDGVMDSPLHTFLKWLYHPTYWPQGWEGIKNEGKIKLSDWRGFYQLTEATSRLVIWTSRRIPNSFPGNIIAPLFSAPITYWPFLELSSLERIKNLKPPKIEVRPEKPLRVKDRASSLAEIIASHHQIPNITYYFGSSYFDRHCACKFADRFPFLAPRFIFLDTGHLII